MLIRITGGQSGIADYLQNGQKADGEFTRDELDERVILDGDLELTDTIINDMQKDGERYLHITLAFKEDYINKDVMQDIVSDFKEFAFSAYQDDEYNFYAEAHLPKLKSYLNRQTGDLVERKPHIHIVIPEKNLLTGRNLNPFGKVEQQIKFADSFQEHINAKYGLASPKDNRRTTFTSESEMISRYKGDLFQGSAKELKERILSDVLDRKISDYGSFKTLLTEYGATRSRNAGTATEYQNVKPADQAKGINLKDYVFSREFIEKPDAEKRRHLADEGRKQYENQREPRKTAPELAAALTEWHEIRAKEIKYINSGNRKLYAEYKAADRSGKIAILDTRAARFNQKYRGENEHERTDERGTDSRRTVAHIADNLRAAGRNIESTGRSVGDSEQASRNLADRRASRAVAALGRRLGCDQSEDRQVSLAAPQPRDRREADNVTSQLLAEARERKTEGKAAYLAEFAQIKRELDARRLLAHLSKTHGVIPEKYEVTKGKDGGDRIKTGSRNLNVSDFLTQEVRLSFSEAAPILRQAYAAQQSRELAEARPSPRRELWQAFKEAQPDRAKQKKDDWDAQRQSERDRRAAIRNDYQAARRAVQADLSKPTTARKAAVSIARMERVTRDMTLRESIRNERKALKDKYGQSHQERYRSYLVELASNGNADALAELRRQRVMTPITPVGERIEHKEPGHERTTTALMKQAAYTVDSNGNVTYYDNSRRAMFTDNGRAVSFAQTEREVLETGLRLALVKFGPNIRVRGTEDYKKKMVEVAADAGLRVEFDDKELQDSYKRRLEAIQAGREYFAGSNNKQHSPQVEPEKEVQREQLHEQLQRPGYEQER